MTAAEIRTPSAANRRISFPYTKFMNANMMVDMSAALILCSVAQARRLGISPDKWVYPLAGARGYDHFSASVRDDFHTSPAIRFTGRRLFDLAGGGGERSGLRGPVQLLPPPPCKWPHRNWDLPKSAR